MKKLVEQIFEEYVLTAEFTDMCKEYEATNKAFVEAEEKANKRFIQSLIEENVKKALENDDILTTAEVEHDKRGFVLGFKLAMRIREECLSL